MLIYPFLFVTLILAFKLLMERLLREFHHLMCVSPRIQSVVDDKRREIIEQMGRCRGGIIHTLVVKHEIHPLAHHLFLRISLANAVKLLSPFVDLFAEVYLHRAYALATQA